ncbi:guanine nucleotide exchange protein for ADP-robosylation factor [Sorochytrium milnesiophthora]
MNRAGTTSQIGNGPTSTQLFVQMALEKIVQSKEVKRFPKLKESAMQSLAYIGCSANAAISPAHMRDICAVLQMACQTRSTLLMAVSLDCLGKLISYNILEDSTATRSPLPAVDDAEKDELSKSNSDLPASGQQPAGAAADEGKSLVDLTVESICDCFIGESTDDSVQLQVIKALLAAVSSTSVPIHGSVLLKTIRTTYNIFLLSRSQSIQTVAQGTLTQMMQIVFGRVKPTAMPASPTPQGSPMHRATSRGNILQASSSGPLGASPQPDTPTQDLHAFPALSNVSAALASPTMAESDSAAAEHVATMADASVTPLASPVPSSAAGGDEQSVGGSAEPQGGSVSDIQIKSPAINGHSATPQPVTQNDLFLRDAFLVFRALCKLSTKSLPGESMADIKTPALRSRILALHLILSIMTAHPQIMNCAMASPHSSDPHTVVLFTEAVKSYLILAVSRSAVSPLPPIFEVALEIFAKIATGWRHLFKKEIEIFLSEILLPILEMRNASYQQKYGFLNCCGKIFSIPQALVEVYLNYDCDKEAMDNIFERVVNAVSKLASTHINPANEAATPLTVNNGLGNTFSDSTITLPPTLATMAAPSPVAATSGGAPDVALKRKSLETMVIITRSMAQWCKQSQRVATPEPSDQNDDEGTAGGENDADNFTKGNNVADRPEHFENMKQRKTVLMQGIKKFNAKPKKGIAFLVEHECIASGKPADVAQFLYTTDGLNKVAIGEYLGEGDQENVDTMHAFVDLMDFAGMTFVDALRTLLQSFRLPGESQKIDRYMLKFAERYTTNNPNIFANADTGYVLSYSVIMLNTDAHNPQVKKRMTKQEFIRNNRGINDNADLPEEFLNAIYDEIQTNEIKLKDDPMADMLKTQSKDAAGGGAAVAAQRKTPKQKREAYALALEEIATKVESLFKSASKKNKGSAYYFASHYEHVRPMFELVWMGVLAGFSGPLQESEDGEIISICLEGFKHSVRIICVFGMELERNAFITTISKFTFLNNLGEMRPKNMETIKTLLEIALTEGDYLQNSWLEVLTCVSQLERFQLISGGITSDSVPDLSLAKRISLASVVGGGGGAAAGAGGSAGKKAGAGGTRSSPRPPLANIMTDTAALESLSQSVVVAVDRIFSNSAKLSGPAIVDFVKWLCHVSWEEIQSSAHVERPRMFSLQKLVEISYYNMQRIRVEWSNLWAILGEHFNKVGCHSNTNVAFFALDSLRQLSMKFLEKDELSNFKFQREFLRPFEFVISNNSTHSIKDMVLRCLQQMVQARSALIKSGWKTMLGVFAVAAKDSNEQIVQFAFDISKSVFKQSFASVVINNTYTDFITCMVEFAKNKLFLKISLHSVEIIHQAVPIVSEYAQKELANGAKVDENTPAAEDPSLRLWFPTLFGLHEIVMTGDLEVRTRALNYLFETLKLHGRSYTKDFWQVLASGVLFPIFDDLKNGRSDYSKFANREDMNVWLSTTLIQALRQFVDLFTFYFDTLQFLMPGLLDLLKVCIIQENETLARLGTSCLQQLIENNASKFNEANWDVLAATFTNLFEATTAYALFEGTGDPEILLKIREQQQLARNTMSESNSPVNPASATGSAVSLANPDAGAAIANADSARPSEDSQPLAAVLLSQHKERSFQQIIVKCVLQLLLIQTLNEMLVLNDVVYRHLSSRHLFIFLDSLDKSYNFARRFNLNLELRTSLWKAGFTKQLPNLLKQETTSVSCFVSILIKMFADSSLDRIGVHDDIERRMIPLVIEILDSYNGMDSEVKRRNMGAWRPVIVSILYGISTFDDAAFRRHIPRFYKFMVDLLLADVPEDLRVVLHRNLQRTGQVYAITDQKSSESANGHMDSGASATSTSSPVKSDAE